MGANLIIPKIHIIVPNLKVDPNQVDQRDVVTEVDLGDVIKNEAKKREHVGVMASTGHHKLDGYTKQAARFCLIV